jgi:hypothetical protein
MSVRKDPEGTRTCVFMCVYICDMCMCACMLEIMMVIMMKCMHALMQYIKFSYSSYYLMCLHIFASTEVKL